MRKYRVGYARDGAARGSLIVVDDGPDGTFVTVIPAGTKRADYDDDPVDAQFLETVTGQWDMLWFDDYLSQRMASLLRSPDPVIPIDQAGGEPASDTQSLAQFVRRRLAESGMWIVSPNLQSLVEVLSIVANREDDALRVFRKTKKVAWILEPFFKIFQSRGLVLVVASREKIPRDLW